MFLKALIFHSKSSKIDTVKTVGYLFFFLISFQLQARIRGPARPMVTKLTEKGLLCPNNSKDMMSVMFGTFSREDINGVLSFKSEDDIDKWMGCYTTKAGYEEYEKTKDILRAAEAQFGVPYALLACKIWQETHWINGRVSIDNARGVVQVVPDQVDTVRRIMELPNILNMNEEERKKNQIPEYMYNDLKAYKDLDDQHEATYAEYRELESKLDKMDESKVEKSKEMERMDLLNAKRSDLERKIRAMRNEKEHVRNYDQAIVLRPRWNNWAAKNNLENNLCSSTSCKTANDYARYSNVKWAVGAGALSAMQFMLKLDDDFKRKFENSDEHMSYSREELSLILATAYNSGPSGPVQELKPIKEIEHGASRREKLKRIEDLLTDMKRRGMPGIRGWGQTACYVSNIDACMRPGNMKPVTRETPSQPAEYCGVSDAKQGEPSNNLIECR